MPRDQRHRAGNRVIDDRLAQDGGGVLQPLGRQAHSIGRGAWCRLGSSEQAGDEGEAAQGQDDVVHAGG